ncbi:unnamed protein product [Allacma fusca]|uniref:Condensin complex subunit 2 n=1 Tax=Allacma fusca TaxID=39272 RepID=A0A8J2L6V5_9HEXA|nr:unnamed protein product [Allacma fusca]
MKRRCTKAWGRNGKVLSNGSEESGNSDSSDEKRMLLGYGIDMMEESHKVMYRKNQSTGQDSGIFCSQENTITDQEIDSLPLEEASERSSCSRSVDSSADDDSDESAPDVGSFEEASVTPEVAQQIFADCCALYKARKISADNAFKLKLVECLSEILKLEQFVGNLMLATHAVEIGGMIYRCRVDCTYRSTCRLVEFVSRFVEKEHDNVSAEQEQFQVEKPQVLAAGKNRQRLSKGRFVTDDDGKLNVQFEYKSSDAASRRVSLQTNLTRYINEDMDFNYSSYFKSMHYQEAAEQRALVSDVTTELSYGKWTQCHAVLTVIRK